MLTSAPGDWKVATLGTGGTQPDLTAETIETLLPGPALASGRSIQPARSQIFIACLLDEDINRRKIRVSQGQLTREGKMTFDEAIASEEEATASCVD
jgi:hypothetical protein